MHFLRLNVTFHDAINIIHDVIIKRNPYPYTTKFVFLVVRINTDQEMRSSKINKKNVHSVVVNQKYLTRLEEMIIFEPRLENYQFSEPR